VSAGAEHVLAQLAQRFGLDCSRIGRPDVFTGAIASALVLMPASVVVDEVAALGSRVRTDRDPSGWGVVLARLRRLPEVCQARAQVLDEQAEAKRWRSVDMAAKRGETLRALVERGDLTRPEALEQLGADFSDDADLAAIAAAAVTGGGNL
jgi:hypothetical protein